MRYRCIKYLTGMPGWFLDKAPTRLIVVTVTLACGQQKRGHCRVIDIIARHIHNSNTRMTSRGLGIHVCHHMFLEHKVFLSHAPDMVIKVRPAEWKFTFLRFLERNSLRWHRHGNLCHSVTTDRLYVTNIRGAYVSFAVTAKAIQARSAFCVPNGGTTACRSIVCRNGCIYQQ